MIRILYISAASGDVPDSEIAKILAASRRNNAAAGVTGLLLHIDGGFLQILEGPETAVDATLLRITSDNRHRHVITLWRETIAERGFAEWSMGFDRLTTSDALWDGAFRIDPRDPADLLAPGAAPEILDFMKSFYDAASARRFA